MSDKMFSESTLAIQSRFQARAVEASGNETTGHSFDPTIITGVINILLPLIQQLAALCKKTPPTPPPVPEALTTSGVSKESWGKAFQANWGATEAWDPAKQTYRVTAINKSAKAIAEKNGTKKRLEKSAAQAAFETARTEDVNELALAIHEQA